MARILVVDDDPQITTLLNTLLSLQGFEVHVVNDSTQAMAAAASTTPDLFILDLMMPQPNGYEICRLIRSDPKFRNTPILIITAADDYGSKAISRAAGANDYMTKPFDQDELPKVIRSLIKLHKTNP